MTSRNLAGARNEVHYRSHARWVRIGIFGRTQSCDAEIVDASRLDKSNPTSCLAFYETIPWVISNLGEERLMYRWIAATTDVFGLAGWEVEFERF